MGLVFMFAAAVGVVAFAFVIGIMIIVLMDYRAREITNQLPQQPGQASNVQEHGLRFPTGDNQ